MIDGVDQKRKRALTLGIIFGSVATCITVVSISFVLPAFRRVCLPFIPATDQQIKNVISAIKHVGKLKKCDTIENVLEVGSGDGRVIFNIRKSNMVHNVDGIELNFWLCNWSRFKNLMQPNLFGKSKIFNRDMWKFDIFKYQTLVLFGVEQMMVEMEKKLTNKKDCYLVCCRFILPNTTPIFTVGEGVDKVFLYHSKLTFKK